MPMAEEATGLSENLRRLRDAAGMSQQALAEKAGVSWSIIASLEQGKSANPRLSTLRALATALGVKLHDLAGD